MASGTGSGGSSGGFSAHSADAAVTAKSFDKLIARLLANQRKADRGEDGKSQQAFMIRSSSASVKEICRPSVAGYYPA
jgi:hypothetical protein